MGHGSMRGDLHDGSSMMSALDVGNLQCLFIIAYKSEEMALGVGIVSFLFGCSSWLMLLFFFSLSGSIRPVLYSLY